MSSNSLISSKLGDYLIQSKLGQGGMATVYKGYDENLDRYAAVKVVHIATVADDDRVEYLERFSREARSIARLSHPGIVGIYQFGVVGEADMYYMAMVFIEGRDLRQILKEYHRRGRRMSNSQIVRIVRDVAHALDYAHQQGVIHRDIKPSNIMVNEEGHAVLTDFGLALNTQEGTVGNTFGSVHYIAPEQAVNSAEATGQSDLYSLGVVLYEMLTGRVPFDDDSAMSVALKHISAPPPRPSEIVPEISAAVEEVVMKALNKEPERRYATGAAFAAALELAFASAGDDDTHDLDAPSRSALARSITGTGAVSANTPPRQPAVRISSGLIMQAQQEDSTQPSGGAGDDGNPTIPSDPSRPSRRRIEAAIPEQSAGNRTGLWVAAGIVLLLMIGAVLIVFASGVLTPGAPTPTQIAAAIESTATVNATATASDTATRTPNRTDTTAAVLVATEAEIEATETETDSPSVTATQQASLTPDGSPTAAQTLATAAAATSTQTSSRPTATPGLSAGADEAPVLLRYDGRTLILMNRSTSFVYIGDLIFLQRTPNREIRYAAVEWQNTDDVVPNEVCFQVWSPSYRSLPADAFPADVCNSRRAFGMTSRTFWLSNRPDAVFEVRRGDEVLATCPAIPPVTSQGDAAAPPTYIHCAVEVPRFN
jgi:serine/threonine protein kinase